MDQLTGLQKNFNLDFLKFFHFLTQLQLLFSFFMMLTRPSGFLIHTWDLRDFIFISIWVNLCIYLHISFFINTKKKVLKKQQIYSKNSMQSPDFTVFFLKIRFFVKIGNFKFAILSETKQSLNKKSNLSAKFIDQQFRQFYVLTINFVTCSK